MEVVRPSAASLNSLAEVLRQAHPLYVECRSILSHLDTRGDIVFLSALEDPAIHFKGLPFNNDAASQHHSVLEHTIDQKSIRRPC